MSSTKRILNMCDIEPEPALITEYDQKILKKNIVSTPTEEGGVAITQE